MRSLYANVVGRFLDDTAGNFVKLRHALHQENFSSIQAAAHSLKGVAAMCGATCVEATLSELELAAKKRDSSSLQELSERLEREMRTARSVLAPFREPG
jgi:HPt (histidine-containing phosphotransfer) domain-containing protein